MNSWDTPMNEQAYHPPPDLPITEQLRLARIHYRISLPRLSLGLGYAHATIANRETTNANLDLPRLTAWADILGYRYNPDADPVLAPYKIPHNWEFPTMIAKRPKRWQQAEYRSKP